MIFVIFPNQLFYNIHFPSCHEIWIVEEPLFFYDNKFRPNIRPHKIKIAYMVACMHNYFDYLLSSDVKAKVKYIKYSDVSNTLRQNTTFMTSEVYDYDLTKKYKNMTIVNDVSPYFLMKTSKLQDYYKSVENKKRVTHVHFYNYVKKTLHVLQNIPSFDKENRQSLPKHFSLPYSSLPKFQSRYHTFAKQYVINHSIFSKHIGSLENLTMLPVSPEQALTNLDFFCQHKFGLFGKYQDAIDSKHVFLFHSNISSSMNIGIITPSEVIQHIMKYKHQVPLNSFEGFIRQIIGWREWCRFLYQFYYDQLKDSNHFGASYTIGKEWYTGSTGLSPVDEEIKKILEFGYAHHIVRLMIFLNIFTLHGKTLDEIYKWFMTMIAIDAYDWVMRPNIAIMSHYWPYATRKPYISSSSYIKRMSNYIKGDWCKTWDQLFYEFLKKNKNKLEGSARIYLRNLKNLK